MTEIKFLLIGSSAHTNVENSGNIFLATYRVWSKHCQWHELRNIDQTMISAQCLIRSIWFCKFFYKVHSMMSGIMEVDLQSNQTIFVKILLFSHFFLLFRHTLRLHFLFFAYIATAKWIFNFSPMKKEKENKKRLLKCIACFWYNFISFWVRWLC